MGRRLALLVGTATYDDLTFAPLRSPRADVEALGEVLADPTIGGYEVRTLVDASERAVSNAVVDVFEDRSPDDLVLFYFSGHGVRDLEGRLYLTARDSLFRRLSVSAVPETFIDDQMRQTSAARIVALLDCCYSGAFGSGLKGADDDAIGRALQGEGRVVITASGPTQEASEGTGDLSTFTAVLVEGLRTGDADLDGDGSVSVHDLYGYVRGEMRRRGAAQTPREITRLDGTLSVARNARWRRALAPDLVEQLSSPSWLQRREASMLLGEQLSRASDPVAQRVALSELRKVARDADERVRSMAIGLLHKHAVVTSGSGGHQQGLEVEPAVEASGRPATDPLWYQRATFYEITVRSFYDSNGDGVGDLRGLASKLDYLEWLRCGCLLLSPILASPRRDGGYDVSDFLGLDPEVGDLADLVTLVDEAHRRGIRVVMDLVLDHTSDAHPWFQASRSEPDGSYGDFFIWSDDASRYPDVRILLPDIERSNWAFDAERRQYYWHRYHAHEPALNYDNPAVADAMLDVVTFWLDMGIDGLRLRGCPYLHQEEGTSCENLPRTHEYLKRLRREVDSRFDDRILIVDAHQWPADAAEYFGSGDECHLAFHYPLVPRIFIAVRRESAQPISDILATTPDIPAACRWAIFLRKDDDLTHATVGDEERDYMHAEYAKDPRMRSGVGIRRRLAPLLDNSRAQIELFTALLLSLPGSPVLYYGDEIGMGDNIYLGDRDGVRTPMQWSSDRNGGFSSADPEQLSPQPLAGPLYGYQVVNVEAQLRAPHSLLHWTRRLLEVRARHPAFGMGGYQELGGSNPSALAFVRRYHDDVVLCVSNLSRVAQPVELDLATYKGSLLVDLIGGVAFPRVGEQPYLLTLAPHSWLWFAVQGEPSR